MSQPCDTEMEEGGGEKYAHRVRGSKSLYQMVAYHQDVKTSFDQAIGDLYNS